MINLFVSPPDWGASHGGDSAETLLSLFRRLGREVSGSIEASGSRSEARLWLCKTVSRSRSLSPDDRRRLFVNMLREETIGRELASHLVQMVFEERPRMAGSVLARRSRVLEKFFKGNPRRVLEWFSHFDAGGGSDHKKGAKVLSQFAFVNRDICWEELEWTGKHGQSPAMVATKPHYFLELDIVRTVENFIEYVPEFWSSTEFAQSLRDGEIFSIDTKYFVELFVDWFYDEDSRYVWETVNDFLMDVSFSSLCDRLLITLKESGLSFFLKLFGSFLSSKRERKKFDEPIDWLEMVLVNCENPSIDEILLVNALVSHRRQLLRLINDEENKEAKRSIDGLIFEVTGALDYGFASIMKEFLAISIFNVVKMLGLLAWVVHYRISKECQSIKSWQSLFENNGITYQKPDIHPTSHDDDIGRAESWSDLDDEPSFGTRRKKKEKKEVKKKKRKRKSHCDDCRDTEILNFNFFDDESTVHYQSTSWLLSTDDFHTSWTNADLPEHLATYCFSVWMKQLYDKRRDVA